MQYTLVGTDDGSTITVYVKGGEPMLAHSSHPNFDAILEGVLADDEAVVDLFDISRTAASRFEKLTERVSVAHGKVYLDNEEVNDAIAEQITRFIDEGVEDWKPLVAFFENVQANPNDHSREQLYNWLSKRDFTITEDGLIVGYKGVAIDGDQFVSIHSGRAIVDGEVKTGRIPNYIGAVVEMPRNEVTWDPSIGCHSGLHVGTYEYANSFANGALLQVHVNPRDVVSVPTDCDWAKVRCCRYTVIDTIDAPHTVSVLFYDDDDRDGWGDFEDDDNYCPYCGTDDLCDCEEDEVDYVKPNLQDLTDNLSVQHLPGVSSVDTDEQIALVDYGVEVGDVYRNTDKRRNGVTFKVESIEGDYAVGKSLPQNVTRKVRLDRLDSYRYERV